MNALTIHDHHFGGAVTRLHISQPALTRQMQLLEHDLGGRILERTSAGVHPTNEGHALAEKARAITILQWPKPEG